MNVKAISTSISTSISISKSLNSDWRLRFDSEQRLAAVFTISKRSIDELLPLLELESKLHYVWKMTTKCEVWWSSTNVWSHWKQNWFNSLVDICEQHLYEINELNAFLFIFSTWSCRSTLPRTIWRTGKNSFFVICVDESSTFLWTNQTFNDQFTKFVWISQAYAHPDNCDQFFLCTNGTLTLETCENGLLFDGKGAVHNHCNYNWAVDCGPRKFDRKYP